MTVIAVDTSALLSIFKGESEGEAWLELLHAMSGTKSLIVSTIVLGVWKLTFERLERHPSEHHSLFSV